MIAGYWLWIGLGALVLECLFSVLTLSLRRLGRSALGGLEEEDTARTRLTSILEDADGHASAMALLRVASTLVVVVACVRWVAHVSGAEQVELSHLLSGLGLAILLVWLIGTAFATAVAKHAGDTVVRWLSPFVILVYVLTIPLRAIADFVDEVVRRLAGGERGNGVEEIEQELLTVVEEGEREGRFDEASRDMIEAVMEFRTTTVEEIMTPRTEVVALAYTDDLEEVKRFVREVGHSRSPVYDENLDHVVGMLYAKDLLRWMAREDASDADAFVLREILRPAMFVPETKTVRELMEQLLSQNVHIAMVADEYGGTAGLVTIEDIVEEIVGEIHDEYEQPELDEPTVEVWQDARSAEGDARIEIDTLNDVLEAIELEVPEGDDYDTLGGFVTVTLGRIPSVGESFEAGDVKVTVLEAEPTRVIRVRIEQKPPVEAEPEDQAKAG